MPNKYYAKSTIRLECKIVDIKGSLVNPSALKFTLQDPAENEISYELGIDEELVNPSVGTFYVDYLATMSGDHKYKWEASGSVSSTEFGMFYIDEDLF